MHSGRATRGNNKEGTLKACYEILDIIANATQGTKMMTVATGNDVLRTLGVNMGLLKLELRVNEVVWIDDDADEGLAF